MSTAVSSTPLIHLTKTATKRLLNIVNSHKADAIFFYLKSGGCNGFEYAFKPIEKIHNTKNVSHFANGALKVEVCDKSIMFVLGTKIDWSNAGIMGEMFTFDNPLSKNSCGCGSSFTP